MNECLLEHLSILISNELLLPSHIVLQEPEQIPQKNRPNLIDIINPELLHDLLLTTQDTQQKHLETHLFIMTTFH